MTLIEKLLNTQTLQGPYLGEVRMPTQQLQQALQQALPKAVAFPEPQSLQTQLHLNLQIKVNAQVNQQAAQIQNQSSNLFLQSSQVLSAKLSQNTIQQIQQHPIDSILSLRIEELFLLQMLMRKVRRQIPEQLVPSPFAQLSYIPTERPFDRLRQSKRKLQVGGLSFLRFRFAWEDDDHDSNPTDRR